MTAATLTCVNSATSTADLDEQTLRVLDGLSLRSLREATTMSEIFEAAGFTIHYRRQAAPDLTGTFNDNTIDNPNEIIAEHPASGLWFASSPPMRNLACVSDAVRVVEDLMNGVVLPAPSLSALTLAVADKATRYRVRVGGHWKPGGLLLGCLDVHDRTATEPAAVRTLIALTHPTLLGEVERLTCWQSHVNTDRTENTTAVLTAYENASAALWPRYAGAAPTIAADLKPDLLLSYPRDTWPTMSVQVILDEVASHNLRLAPLKASWAITHGHDVPFSVEALLNAAVVPPGVDRPAVTA